MLLGGATLAGGYIWWNFVGSGLGLIGREEFIPLPM